MARFTVSLVNGSTFQTSLEICLDDTIYQVKQKIENNHQVKIENQELFLGGKKLEENQTVRNYNIGLGETINLVQKHEGIMQVFIKDLNGSGSSTGIFINYSSTVLELKQSYGSISKIPVYEQRLIYGGKQLEDHKKLSEYKIEHGSTIRLVLRLVGGR
ncbi:24279_t:CDS:1 [Cetraspora pellucida]|uniref:24279_t:CDS:1 n=1 Tax=Cetraspora pellucida TaxID=1433469 RepID=A0A9N9CYP9_9GLOM|nr:24279_t:CDS:1 [Cetraspora pellucida]